jgi:hypothetical protein
MEDLFTKLTKGLQEKQATVEANLAEYNYALANNAKEEEMRLDRRDYLQTKIKGNTLLVNSGDEQAIADQQKCQNEIEKIASTLAALTEQDALLGSERAQNQAALEDLKYKQLLVCFYAAEHAYFKSFQRYYQLIQDANAAGAAADAHNAERRQTYDQLKQLGSKSDLPELADVAMGSDANKIADCQQHMAEIMSKMKSLEE